MADFLPAYEATMLAEGGYRLTNDPVDRGGQTYAGISRRWHPKWAGWAFIDAGDRPPASMVRAFYREKFWDELRLDEVQSQKVANSLYGSGVNSDPKIAAKLAQLVVGATPDGALGPVTLGLINAMAPDVFIAQFTIAKIARYRDIVTKDRSQMKYLLGWVSRALREAE
jgi:lysozyme family protein